MTISPRRCLMWKVCGIGAPILVALLLVPSLVWSYRPFVSTDAAVAAPREVEIELGSVTLERTRRETTFSVPSLVVNYGVVAAWEVVAEFRTEASPEFELADPALLVKGVLKEGVLQDKEGVSVAVEAGALLPSTLRGEHGIGFEAIGIVSGRLGPFMLHVNGGGGVDRGGGRPFGLWGLIGELPVHPRVRIVSEVEGQTTSARAPNDSALLGIIWKPTSSNVYLDAGIRHGLSRGAPDWLATVGLTFGFSISPFWRSPF